MSSYAKEAEAVLKRARRQAAYGNDIAAALLYGEAQVLATLAVAENTEPTVYNVTNIAGPTP